MFTTSKKGYPIICINGYRFNKQNMRGERTSWQCSTHHSRGCRAIVRPFFVLSRSGKKMINVDGYTFYSATGAGLRTRWRCSTHNNRGCTASILTIEEEIVKINNNHNH
ncbi:hypothetical protein K1T71_006546 [Dendrolimus kikuchii]|uniref:Uncharacterized protein n=1 Tax=Dendrolimus kikuchii TaxID=765133 RepID=A0ACC1D267_9NEOP|nr:hypothetical protein K1T71_006546 [Dendrolimus kikuchii]